jgi:hypothetical protein
VWQRGDFEANEPPRRLWVSCVSSGDTLGTGWTQDIVVWLAHGERHEIAEKFLSGSEVIKVTI